MAENQFSPGVLNVSPSIELRGDCPFALIVNSINNKIYVTTKPEDVNLRADRLTITTKVIDGATLKVIKNLPGYLGSCSK